MSERQSRRGARIGLGVFLVLLVLAGAWLATLPSGLGRVPLLSDLPGFGGPDPAAFGPEVAEAHAACARRGEDEKRACYEEALTRRIAAEGPDAALAMLEGLSEVDGDAARDGHHHAHHIGLEAYRLGDGLAEVFPRCTEAFASGCYHGVIQAHFLAHGAEGVDDAVLRETCEPYRGAAGDRWMLFQCLHGLGHGLALHLRGDLFEALASCDALPGRWERESCYGGAFMQNVVFAVEPHGAAAGGEMAHAAHPPDATGSPGHGSDAAGPTGHGPDAAPREGHESHAMGDADGSAGTGSARAGGAARTASAAPVSPVLDEEDPLYPCTALPERYLRACYSMQSSAVLWMADGNLRAAGRSCARAPEAWRAVCFQGLGRDVVGRARYDPARSHRLCRRLGEEGASWCYAGVAKNMVNQEARPHRAFRFCRRIGEGAERAACFEATGEAAYYLAPDAEGRARLCMEAGDPPDVEACRRGARLRSAEPGERRAPSSTAALPAASGAPDRS